MTIPTARHRIRTSAALAACLALVATACGSDSTSSTAGDPTTSATDAATSEGSTADGETADSDPDRESVTVTLLTHDSFNVSESVLDDFTAETGITVAVLPAGDAGAMVNQAILTRDAPLADILFGVDNTFLSRALEQDLFVPYAPAALDHVDPALVLDDQHRVVPVDFGDVCLNYDRVWFDEHDLAVPTTLQDLADPAYAELLVVENPATSSPGLAFLLASVAAFGDEAFDWWADLVTGGVEVTSGWEDAYYGEFSGGAGQGDRPLVVSYASSPPAEVLYGPDPEATEAPTGTLLETCFRQIEFAGILQGTEHPEAAEQVMDLLLSPAFQADVPLSMFVFPARTDVELPEVFERFAELAETPWSVDPEEIAARRDEWIDAWTDTVLR